MPTARRSLDLLIIALIIANGAGIAFFYVIRSRAGLYAIRSTFPTPSGYGLDKRFIPPTAAPCYLLRITANGCPYCRADRPWYGQLLETARGARCEVLAIAPRAGDDPAHEAPPESPLELQFVDMNLGRVVIPYTVPQTILLDRLGRVLWYRVGSMDPDALKNGLTALGDAGRPQG